MEESEFYDQELLCITKTLLSARPELASMPDVFAESVVSITEAVVRRRKMAMQSGHWGEDFGTSSDDSGSARRL